MEMGSYPTLDWHNTTDSSLRWLREYFLFSFIKPRNRQKTACQTGVSRFTAKEMGKSFLRTYFIWNTFSKITKSCVFLPHNPFISYLDKKSYFFLILDILPSSSRLQKDKILRHFKARRQRIAWNLYFFICQCININIILSCPARSIQSLFGVYLPSGKRSWSLVASWYWLQWRSNPNWTIFVLGENFSSAPMRGRGHPCFQWCTPARTHSEYFNEIQYQSMAHKHQSPERNSWNRSTIKISFGPGYWLNIWMIFSQTTKLTLSILQNPFKTFKSLEIPLIH